MRDKPFYSPKEAAPRLAVSYWTVLRMIARGQILVVSMPTERFKIPAAEIERIMTPKLMVAHKRLT
jgi:excisionase family DNA binding protein